MDSEIFAVIFRCNSKLDTQVNGIPATLIVSSMEGNFSSVTWRDTASNIEFTLAAVADESVIIAMAESVSLCNSTN